MAEPTRAAADVSENGSGQTAALGSVSPITPPGFAPRKKEHVIQLSTRVRISIKDHLDEYHAATGVSIQDQIDMALVEHFRKAGILPPEGEE